MSSPDQSSAATEGAAIEFEYTNWEGRKGIRQAIPLNIRFGKSEWHDVPQWLMLAYDIDKQAEREYAMADMQFEDGFLPGIDLALNEPQAAPKLSDFAELKLLIDEYDPENSDWNFRRGVLLDILVRIWPTSSQVTRPK